MSIRGKIANWLVNGEIDSLQLYIARLERANDERTHAGHEAYKEFTRIIGERSALSAEVDAMKSALKRIYDIPCTDKSSGSLKRAVKIAAHALWKE